MNKKGFISISVVYSFFLVFIARVLSIIAAYYSRRLMLLEVKKDIRNVIDEHTSYDCFSKGITKLNECIIDTYGGEDEIKSQPSPDLSQVTSEDEYGLYVSEDDYGDSYYFRGDVKNNYVKFAQNDDGVDMYWRIVRINGDGTIRLIYDGTILDNNGIENVSIIDYDFYNTQGNSIKYAGYTYDNGTGVQVDSMIKAKLDSWYLNNLLDYYNDYIADALFCNDRSLVSGSTNEYAASKRILSLTDATLKCPNKEDRYTVDDITTGNGLLTYPIATITADEVVYAGADTYSSNPKLYLTRSGIWTMTPSYFVGYENKAMMWMFSSAGNLSHFYGEYNLIYFVDQKELGYRPVINIRSDIKIKKGNGRIDNPYILEEVNY